MPQKQRIGQLRNLTIEEQPDSRALPLGELIVAAEDEIDLIKKVTKATVDKMCEKSKTYLPDGNGTIRVFK